MQNRPCVCDGMRWWECGWRRQGWTVGWTLVFPGGRCWGLRQTGTQKEKQSHTIHCWETVVNNGTQEKLYTVIHAWISYLHSSALNMLVSWVWRGERSGGGRRCGQRGWGSGLVGAGKLSPSPGGGAWFVWILTLKKISIYHTSIAVH